MRDDRPSIESRIGRLLTIGVYGSMALIAVGVALMALTGRSPLDVAPALDPGRLVADVVALRPAGFLWLGLAGLLATPAARVVAALVAFVRGGEREMAGVAVAILVVIAIGVLSGTVAG